MRARHGGPFLADLLRLSRTHSHVICVTVPRPIYESFLPPSGGFRRSGVFVDQHEEYFLSFLHPIQLAPIRWIRHEYSVRHQVSRSVKRHGWDVGGFPGDHVHRSDLAMIAEGVSGKSVHDNAPLPGRHLERTGGCFSGEGEFSSHGLHRRMFGHDEDFVNGLLRHLRQPKIQRKKPIPFHGPRRDRRAIAAGEARKRHYGQGEKQRQTTTSLHGKYLLADCLPESHEQDVSLCVSVDGKGSMKPRYPWILDLNHS